ncbi:MAG TPA: hypothetical protein VF607_06100, partial [Verrucomicrobiae bacterium]
KAISRLTTLNNINERAHQPDDLLATLDDLRYAALLTDQGELVNYEKFRRSVMERHSQTTDPIAAERLLRVCLLVKMDRESLSQLNAFQEITVKAMQTNAKKLSPEGMAWHAFSLALAEYRRGDYAAATNWCGRALDFDRGILCRDVGIQLIRAMARSHLGDLAGAREELAACRGLVENEASRFVAKGGRWQGYWFDWAVDRVLLREAVDQIENHPDYLD